MSSISHWIDQTIMAFATVFALSNELLKFNTNINRDSCYKYIKQY